MQRTVLLCLVLGVAACSPRSEAPATSDIGPAPAPAPAVAASDDPAVYRGSALARQACVRCHDVGAGTQPVEQISAPAFRDVAARSDTTPERLTSWMRTSHPEMPTFMFGDADVADLAAYIISLRPPA